MPRETNIQIRRGTANDWTSVNPTLAAGELAMESDTRKIKVGDGSTAWNSLQYVRFDGGDLNGAGGTTTTPAPGATTTTTTTDAPTTTTTTVAPTTTTTAAPTTTTTAAPGVAGFIVSGAGFTPTNGTYCEFGTHLGRPYYKKQGASNYYYLFWDDGNEMPGSIGPAWVLAYSAPGGSFDVDYYIASSASTPPLTGWDSWMGDPPAPTLTQTTC